MVIHRSEPSPAKTSFRGGLRRGAAAAALGVALVFSAGVPASHAAEGNNKPGKPVQAKGAPEDSLIGGVLRGLQNGSAGRANARTAPSEPAPAPAGTEPANPAPASTAPVSTASSRPARPSDPAPTAPARPSDPASPAPTPTSAAPTPASPTAPASPTSPATAPQDVPTQGSPSPGTATQGAGAAPSPSATSDSRNGSAADGTGPDRPAAPGADTKQQESAEQGLLSGPTQGPAETVDETTAGASTAGSTETASHPAAAAAPSARHEMTAGGPAPETTKVWLGVGLVGSAGAAGLLFARIRKF